MEVEEKFRLFCHNCKSYYSAKSGVYNCPECKGRLSVEYTKNEFHIKKTSNLHRGMWKYFSRLALLDSKYIVSLGEGDTPLVKLDNKNFECYLKTESLNPTGTYKDRPASLGVSRARELGANGITVASDANTAPAVAAYSAKAGLDCIVFMPKITPRYRFLQALAYGARVLLIDGTVNDCINLANIVALEKGFHNCSTAGIVNPYELEANRTIAYEIVEDLGDAPDWIALPLGGGGLMVGMCLGFQDLVDSGEISTMPKFLPVQVDSCSPFVLAAETNTKVKEWREIIETIAFPIAVPYPPDGNVALEYLKIAGGTALSVSDEEILEAVYDISNNYGILAEPAGAVSFTGVLKAHRNKIVKDSESCVAIISGTGLKSMDIFSDLENNIYTIDNDINKVLKVLD